VQNPSEAAVTITGDSEKVAFMRSFGEALPALLGVSAATLSEDAAELGVGIVAATGNKCGRCWMVLPSVGEDAEHPTICARCAANVRALT